MHSKNLAIETECDWGVPYLKPKAAPKKALAKPARQPAYHDKSYSVSSPANVIAK